MTISINTTVKGIEWPALPSPIAAARLAALFQLEQTQWWSEEKIRKHQFVQIKSLLQHSLEHVPYYKNVFENKINIETLNETTWLDIPILTRDKVQQSGDSLRSKFTPPGHGSISIQRTSGSTGKPVETLATEINTFFWNVFTLRNHFWHKRDFSLKLAAIRFNTDENAKPPHGIHSTNWGRATHGLTETGASMMLSILTPVSEQVAWLQREKPNYLLTHPSVLQELALHCQRENVQFPSLCEVGTLSEALPEGLRELCHKVWGVKLVDMYSTTELGYLALQCPEHEHYHVQSEGVMFEVLDDNDKPCKPGEVGRVIITNLHNYAFPLIRYEVGDFAELGEACDCGRGLPVIKRIIGRYRNLLTMPSGERHYPQLGIQDLHEIAPVQQFQAVQHSLNDIEIRLILPRPLQAEEKEKLTVLFKEMMGDCFSFDIQQVASLRRSASGKYEEFISEL
ncbi:MAG: AMP-binding protein [Gammaproteobacteria bacterium]|nr:AMP-binding protein [Gammaproteobacteria bacterium]